MSSNYDNADMPRSNNRIKQAKQVIARALVDDKTRIHRRILLKGFSADYKELSLSQTRNGPAHQYSIDQIYFAFTTNTNRIRDSIPHVKFWATTPGVRCLIIFESKDLQSKNYIKTYLEREGILCKIQISNVTRYEARFLELIQQAWYSSNVDSYAGIKAPQWFAIGDDDTIWFLENLLHTLQQYNASDPIYLGNTSDKLEALRRHGAYYAYGGGGILLSRTLALQAAQHKTDCQRFIYMFGGDQMLGKCITEVLKINLTCNRNFHQLDHEGDMDGFLESGMEGLVSLHHMFFYWEPFPEEHTTHPYETIYLLKLAYQTFGYNFLKRYVRVNRQTNQTLLLTVGYSFSLFDRILTYKELMKVEKTWLCCSEFVGRETRAKEKNKMTWYFRAITNETANRVSEFAAVYENKNKHRTVPFSSIEIIVKN